MSKASDLVYVDASRACCSSPWEEAYERFETPEEEIAKFRGRLLKLGAASWDKSLHVVELFCGRGNGLHALSQLGFQHLEGADLSEALLAGYVGPAKCYICDCRHLPFEDRSRHIVIVQGGLHHLPRLPEDLEMVLQEMRRVLKPAGFAVVIEPWRTPFLSLVHAACGLAVARGCFPKLDALATMIENERTTYEQWLSRPKMILELLRNHFPEHTVDTGRGKLQFIGSQTGRC